MKPLLLATSDHNHGGAAIRCSPPLRGSTWWMAMSTGSIRNSTEDANGKKTGFEILNTPMVDDPLHSTVVELSRSAFAGKPYTVSEVGHPFPAEYAAEGIPILTAYAALQDWDGLFWYTFEHTDPKSWKPQLPGHFEVRADPVKMSQIAAGALMFLRGDVRPARETGDTILLHGTNYGQSPRGVQRAPVLHARLPAIVALIHGSRIKVLDGASTGKFAAPASEPILSDTGELAWQKGLVTVETARTQAIIGRRPAEPKAVRNLTVDVRNNFAAIVLTSLDGAPIATSRSMLLVTGSTVANTGQQWNEKRTSLVNWGTAPTTIEPVTGVVTLRNLTNVKSLEIVALDGAGCADRRSHVQARKTAAGWEFEIGATPTPWYRLSVVLVMK